MARAAKQVEGVYEKNKGSGIWYARYRLNGKLVRKKIGTQTQAKSYLDKVNYVRASGDGVVPVSAREVVMTAKEVAAIPDAAGEFTVGQLCDGLLDQIVSDPDRYRDQLNPPHRISLIKEHSDIDRPQVSSLSRSKTGCRVSSGLMVSASQMAHGTGIGRCSLRSMRGVSVL